MASVTECFKYIFYYLVTKFGDASQFKFNSQAEKHKID